jgi:hypothetical protein
VTVAVSVVLAPTTTMGFGGLIETEFTAGAGLTVIAAAPLFVASKPDVAVIIAVPAVTA